jgi:hypothetical protein
MKIFSRDTETGRFYVGRKTWTEDDTEAFDFQETHVVRDAVHEGKLHKIEVLVHFEDPTFEIPLKVIRTEA